MGVGEHWFSLPLREQDGDGQRGLVNAACITHVYELSDGGCEIALENHGFLRTSNTVTQIEGLIRGIRP